MDTPTPSVTKKRTRNDGLSSDLIDAEVLEIGETLPLVHKDLLDEELKLEPARKKVKTHPPRPLRILKPLSLSTPNNPSSPSSPNTLSTTKPSTAPKASNVRQIVHQKAESNSSPAAASSSDIDVEPHVSLNCSYCKRCIEGGIAGLRRHQAGKMHVLNVLRGTLKYLAPSILPASLWAFPRQIPFNIQDRDFMIYFDGQVRQCEQQYSVASSSASNGTSSAESPQQRSEKLDLDLLMFVVVAEPTNLGPLLEAVESAYLAGCRRKNLFPWNKTNSVCPFCEIQNEYSVQKPQGSAALSVDSTAAIHPGGTGSLGDPNSYTHEESLLQFWKHLSSESHRKIVGKFWREHHVQAPSSLSKASPSSYAAPNTAKKRNQKQADNTPLTAQVLAAPVEYFDVSSYALSQGQLQRLLESWSRLKKLVATIPKIRSAVPPEDLAASLPIVPSRAELPSLASTLPIKDQILKRMAPGEPKFNDRVGSKWADAVKSFLSSHPGMTSRQLIQLVRLERTANPHRNKQWYPSFGGVWNETTRANHARSFIASQRDRH